MSEREKERERDGGREKIDGASSAKVCLGICGSRPVALLLLSEAIFSLFRSLSLCYVRDEGRRREGEVESVC